MLVIDVAVVNVEYEDLAGEIGIFHQRNLRYL
jgi:hypothetical protein